MNSGMKLSIMIILLSIASLGQAASSVHRLYIKTTPAKAKIFIMNIKPSFHQGMKLKAGRYDILVNADGYHKQRRWVTLKGKDLHTSFRLKAEARKKAKRYPLTITTHPSDARIRIMNIQPVFKQGMTLATGKYDVLVSHPQFPDRRQWVEIKNQAVNMDVILSKTMPLNVTQHGAAENAPRYQLFVNTTPSDAHVQIMNIVPKFESGIALNAGKYYLRISKKGYPVRREWVTITNKDITLNVNLSPPALCFFGEETRDDKGQRAAVIRSAKLSFHDKFVDASYYVHSTPSGLSNYLKLQGVKKDDTEIDLIGLTQQGQTEEIRATMQLLKNQLLITVHGNQHRLDKVNCN